MSSSDIITVLIFPTYAILIFIVLRDVVKRHNRSYVAETIKERCYSDKELLQTNLE